LYNYLFLQKRAGLQEKTVLFIRARNCAKTMQPLVCLLGPGHTGAYYGGFYRGLTAAIKKHLFFREFSNPLFYRKDMGVVQVFLT
jgi:hypothetical protein